MKAPSWKLGSPPPTAILVCLVVIVCYYAVEIVYVLGIPPRDNPTFWPATPFLVAVLLLTSRKIWPMLAAAGLVAMAIADVKHGTTITSESWFFFSALAALLIATLGLNRVFKGTPRLRSVGSLTKYLAVAVILAPSVAAFVGSTGRLQVAYWLEWRIWIFADALGFLTVTPAILGWVHEGRAWARDYRNHLELAALLAWLVVFGYLTFMRTGWGNSPALLYSLVPPLLWAALRLGLKGVSTSMLLVTFLAIWGAAHDRGPFTGQGPLNNALSLQLFLFFAAIPFMVLAVLVEEQKQAEQAVRESEERFRLVANTAPVMIWMSGVDMLCTYLNQAWLEFTGRSLEAELGNGWTKGLYPGDLERWFDIESKAVERRQSYQMEYRVRRHDGEYRWILQSGVPRFNPDGSFAGYIGSAIDITERKAAEEALSTVSQKLIEAHEEERSWIARELHDDINQRLALLAVHLETLKHDLAASDVRAKRRIEDATTDVGNLASDIQALSHRLHSSKLEYLGLAAASAGLCKELSERQNVEIDFQSDSIPKALPKEISLCLFRVLQEALQNAIKHSGARHFEVSLTEASSAIQLSVHDSGVGFDPEQAMKGGGLGLTSMKERVKLVNGNLFINSRQENGTTIRARVPLSPRTKSATAG
jgi:PAS domain S-box-containing protein